MLFNSYVFILIFLPIVFIVFFSLNKLRLFKAALAFLSLASIVFYAYWKLEYVPILLGSIAFNYLIGKMVFDGRSKALLVFGIVANICLLGYFKYTNFFIDNINNFFNLNIDVAKILLPLAISFFTFQQIAYIVDSYKGKAAGGFIEYVLFVAFFPQLIAGPIVHHGEMIEQFQSQANKMLNINNICNGLFIFSIGIFKKVMIADHLAVHVANGYVAVQNAELIGGFQAWLTSLSYTLQLYFDFSGYCDMAIGIALLFNIKLPINFNSPYKALNIQDFWRRWHMTLSRWLMQYLYIPLGGNRKGEYRTYLNLFLVFLIGGFWHGAGWGFIIWGAMHGGAMVLHRLWQKRQLPKLGIIDENYTVAVSRFCGWLLSFRLVNSTYSLLKTLVAWLLTFMFVNVAWVFFRAPDLESAKRIIVSMFKYYNRDYVPQEAYALVGNINYVSLLISLFVIVLMFKNASQILVKQRLVFAVFAAVIFAYTMLNLTAPSEFLYFNF